MRENHLLSDKNDNSTNTISELQKQIEEILNQKKEEITKIKKDHDSLL